MDKMPTFNFSTKDKTTLADINANLEEWINTVLTRVTAVCATVDMGGNSLIVSQVWRVIFKKVSDAWNPKVKMTDAEVDTYLNSAIASSKLRNVRIVINPMIGENFAQADTEKRTIHINRKWFDSIGSLLTRRQATAANALNPDVAVINTHLLCHFVLLFYKVLHEFTLLLTPSIMAKISLNDMCPQEVPVHTPVQFGTKKVINENGRVAKVGDMGFVFEERCMRLFRLDIYYKGNDPFELSDLMLCTETQEGYVLDAALRDSWLASVSAAPLTDITNILAVIGLPRAAIENMTKVMATRDTKLRRAAKKQRKAVHARMVVGETEDEDEDWDWACEDMEPNIFITRALPPGIKS